MKFTWKEQRGRWQNGDSLYLNRIIVGSATWNTLLSRDLPKEERAAKAYVGRVILPSMERVSLFAPTLEECKSKVEAKVSAWFAEVNRE